MVRFTAKGKETVKAYIAELEAKRKEILDARKDTADYTFLPTPQIIACDVETFIDKDGDYYNGWGVTDNYDADQILGLKEGEDFVITKEANDIRKRIQNRIQAFNEACKELGSYNYYIFPMFGDEFEHVISTWLGTHVTVDNGIDMYGLVSNNELSFFEDLYNADEWIDDITFDDLELNNKMMDILAEKYQENEK